MLSLFDAIRGLGFAAIAVKLLTACLCGTLIGLETLVEKVQQMPGIVSAVGL